MYNYPIFTYYNDKTCYILQEAMTTLQSVSILGSYTLVGSMEHLEAYMMMQRRAVNQKLVDGIAEYGITARIIISF